VCTVQSAGRPVRYMIVRPVYRELTDTVRLRDIGDSRCRRHSTALLLLAAAAGADDVMHKLWQLR